MVKRLLHIFICSALAFKMLTLLVNFGNSFEILFNLESRDDGQPLEQPKLADTWRKTRGDELCDQVQQSEVIGALFQFEES